jgi:hypothetical protein
VKWIAITTLIIAGLVLVSSGRADIYPPTSMPAKHIKAPKRHHEYRPGTYTIFRSSIAGWSMKAFPQLTPAVTSKKAGK